MTLVLKKETLRFLARDTVRMMIPLAPVAIAAAAGCNFTAPCSA